MRTVLKKSVGAMNGNENMRVSCATIALRLWKVIVAIHDRDQVAVIDRIIKLAKQLYNMSYKETKDQLKKCIHDELIMCHNSYAKGRYKRRITRKCYLLPLRGNNSRHDWYCFECHNAGEGLINCFSCHRSYHSTCCEVILGNDSFQCFACKSVHNNTNMSQERLNHLLKYLLSSLKSICPVSLRKWDENDWKDLPVYLIIFKTVDLSTIQKKILNSSYSQIIQVKVDVQNIVHNTYLCHGENSALTKQAEKMLSVCEQMVKEIQLCPDCFLASYEKECKFWFCQPCQIPHQLVYAQVKGYPYWPAKVIEETDLHFDVRFFGGHHQRALVEKNHVLPITTNLLAVQKMPKSAAWDRACEELKCYQTLLENISDDFEKFPSYKRKEGGSQNHATNDTERSMTVFKKNRLTDDEKLSVCTERSNHISSVSRKINRERLECATIQKCFNEVPSKQTNASGSQTYCIYHLHHKSVSKDIKNKEEANDYKMNSCQNGAENYKSCDSPYEEVELHMEANDLCPLNNFENYCVPNCDIEKLKQKRIRAAICKINRHYDNFVVHLAKKHCSILEYVKKNSWCSCCSKKARIHCCWSTEYCSEHCQNKHWVKGHWKVCKSEC